MRLSSLIAGLTLLALTQGCHDDVTSPSNDTPFGVQLTLGPWHCTGTDCQSPGGDYVYPATITIRNTGTAVAFLEPCGSAPRLQLETETNGVWMSKGPAISCPNGLPSITIAPGATLEINKWLTNGKFRYTVNVAASASVTDTKAAVSNAITISRLD